MVYTLVCRKSPLHTPRRPLAHAPSDVTANDKPDSIEAIKRKLIEASRVYRKDKETVDWIVMQDVHDPKKFTIVERFEQESSQKYHLENPYWKTFDPYMEPYLAKPIELARHEELDTSKDVELL